LYHFEYENLNKSVSCVVSGTEQKNGTSPLLPWML
jgi:hypothetical protein